MSQKEERLKFFKKRKAKKKEKSLKLEVNKHFKLREAKTKNKFKTTTPLNLKKKFLII